MDYLQCIELLKSKEGEFLSHCHLSNYQASGPGGQKRNKVKSGIRLELKGTEYYSTSNEQRSPKANTSEAVRKLKLLIALTERHTRKISDLTFPGSGTRINPTNKGYFIFIKQALDVLVIEKGQLKPTAEIFGLSSSAINRIFHREKKIIEKVQKIRSEFDLGPLKP